jgi:DNA polymerase-1
VTATATTTLHQTSRYNWENILEVVDTVSFDTENNGHLNLFDDGVIITGFSLATKVKGALISEYFPVAHGRGVNYDRHVWEPVLRKLITKKVIMHNAKLDMRSAAMLLDEPDIAPFKEFFDTTRMCHMVNENFPQQYSLENCCKHYLGYPGKVKSFEFEALMKAYGWARIAPTEIREYAEADAEATYLLWEVVAAKLAAETGAENIKYWKTLEMPNFKVLYRMQDLGVAVDLDFCKEWEERSERELYKLRQELGFDPAKPTQLKPVIYDELKLPVILGKPDRLGVRKPTLDKTAMEQYDRMMEASGNPLAKKIIEYRGWTKALTSYYRPYQEKVDPDGRIRPDYASHGTVTGRFACSNPNLQQIPKETENKPWSAQVKSCFIPIVGHELWEFDYSQLELRLGAAFGNDQKLLEIFNDPNERDIFSEMAEEMGWPRQQCKTFVYSVDYGAGKGRVSDVFGVSRDKAQQLIDEFYETYSGLGRINGKSKAEAESTGRLRLWSGRYRHFSSREEGYKAFNSLIQGGSADLVKKVMNTIHRELPEVRMLLQVHDSLWFELPHENTQIRRDIVRIMENPFENNDRVKFKVDGHRVGGNKYAMC